MWINNKTIIQFNLTEEYDRKERDLLHDSLIVFGYEEEVISSGRYVQYTKDRLTTIRDSREEVEIEQV